MKPAGSPIRVLTAVPLCDGHDSAVNTINLELVRSGVEVIYLGYHRDARSIVRAAIQEDVRAIGLSSYNGGHVEFFGQVLHLLKKQGAADIGLFGGGGATISPADAAQMHRLGVDRIFYAGTPLSQIVKFVLDRYSRPPRGGKPGSVDRQIGRMISAGRFPFSGPACGALRGGQGSMPRPASGAAKRLHPPVIGFTGPGGAGKSTLIDELVLRYLSSHPRGRAAIVCHDPSLMARALLGDRATMIYCQSDRVFLRSLATRGRSGGIAAATGRCVRILQRYGFDLILLESVGIGQEAVPFDRRLVDRTILVMSPDYGSRLQLQKIAMLDAADIVAVNKSDLGGARTACAEIERRLESNGRGQTLLATIAKRHRDPGVDALFEKLELGGPRK